MSLISVIMPVYNTAHFLQESVDSVLAQSYTNWELIIVDDGSTDESSVIASMNSESDSRIKYYYQDNKRQGMARNFGISKSSGNLLAFLDADDIWMPDKLKNSMNLFGSAGEDLLFLEAYVFGTTEDLKNPESLEVLGIAPGIYQGKSGLARFLYRNEAPLLTVLVKKAVVDAVGGFRDRGVAEDYELWLNLLAAGFKLRGINTPLAFYRIHRDSSTFKDRMAINAVSAMLTDFFSDHPDLMGFSIPQRKNWLKRYILNNMYSNPSLEFPSIFSEFRDYTIKYRILRIMRHTLPKPFFKRLLLFLYRE